MVLLGRAVWRTSRHHDVPHRPAGNATADALGLLIIFFPSRFPSPGPRRQAWSPIGGITSYRGTGTGRTFDDPTIARIAHTHGKTPAQIMLRWHLQQGRSTIPKSTKPARIAEDFDVFDYRLTSDELAALDALETGVRGGPDPADLTLETFGRDIPEA